MPPKTSTNLGTKPSLGDGPWHSWHSWRSWRSRRSRGALIAGFVGVGVVGVILGRMSSPVPEGPAFPAAAHSASPASPTSGRSTSPASEPSASPQQFDLTDDPRNASGVPLRPMDHDIFTLITSLQLDRTRMPDVFPDRPYRVTFIGSIAERRIGLVMIDLDRDGKFDERWDLKRDGVVRNVLKDPAADGNPVNYSLAHGRWQPH